MPIKALPKCKFQRATLLHGLNCSIGQSSLFPSAHFHNARKCAPDLFERIFFALDSFYAQASNGSSIAASFRSSRQTLQVFAVSSTPVSPIS